ncbi:MAG: ABC transporter permease, partial [Spirochaetaceae bacterium]|nr:ABC transporter permease [Spirochaetaceae bacterium]
MYKWFAIKRVLKGVFTYAIIILVLSVLFNTVTDRTVRSDIEEQVRAESSRLKNMQPAALQRFQEQRRQELIKLYRLDRPLTERIIYRAWNTLTFNFGKSTIIKSSRGEREVLAIVGEALPRTLLLFSTAALIEIIVGIILGLKKAQKPGGSMDRITSVITMIVYGMPTFWVAMILIMLFVYQLKIFPSAGMHTVPPPGGIMYFIDLLWHMALPLLTLVLIGFWGVAYYVRNI